jgi:hypothetical protein
MNLGSTVAPEPSLTLAMRVGVVTQVSPLLVRVGAATTATPASALGSYAPRVDDVVTLIEQGADRVVLGAVGAAPILASTSATGSTWTNGTTTETAVTASTGAAPLVTLALNPARRHRMVVNGRFQSSVAGDGIIVRFYEGGAARKAFVMGAAAVNLGQSIHHEWDFVPASGSSVTYEVRAARLSGSGTVAAAASPQTPIDFWIEDVGPA